MVTHHVPRAHIMSAGHIMLEKHIICPKGKHHYSAANEFAALYLI